MSGGARGILGMVCALGLLTAGGGVGVFDGERSFLDLRDLVAIGPRPAGSPGAVLARDLIRQRLRQAGWPVRDQAFKIQPPRGSAIDGLNLIASRRGRKPDLIILATHYDTKRIDGIRFVGANDGASGAALLLELARGLGPEAGEFTLWLAFFDGEEAVGSTITPEDGLYGSRALAAEMARDGSLARVRAFLLVDMVADRDLNLMVDSSSTPELVELMTQEAARLGNAQLVDRSARLTLIDDHTPFIERGVGNVLALIDFQYGARQFPGPLWHSEQDDLTAVSAGSLNSVGRLVVQLLARLERELRDSERAPAS